MYCKHCGARIDGDSQFCPQCGSPVQGTGGFRQQQNWQQPAQPFSQPQRQAAWRESGRRSARRRGPVSAGFQGRLFGILVIVCIILNKTGVLD